MKYLKKNINMNNLKLVSVKTLETINIRIVKFLFFIIHFLMPSLTTNKIIVNILTIVATKITAKLITITNKIILSLFYYALTHMRIYVYFSQHLIKILDISEKLYNDNIVFILNFIYAYKIDKFVIGDYTCTIILFITQSELLIAFIAFTLLFVRHILLYVIYLSLYIVLHL